MILISATCNAADRNGFFHPEAGIGFRFLGGAIVQRATKTKFLPVLLIGCEVDLDIFSIGNNRIGIGVGFLNHFGKEKEGTQQINVLSERRQVDFTLNYKYHWTHLGISAGIGASMGIVSVTMRMYDLGEPSLSSNRDTYIFNNKTLVDEEKSTGTIFGPTAVLSGDLDLGSFFFKERPELDNFWFFDITAQYVLRDLRNEVYFFASTHVIIKKIETNTK